MRIDRRTSLLLALVFVVSFGLGAALKPPANVALPQDGFEDTQNSVSVMIDYGDGEVKTYDGIPVSANENLFQVMGKSAKENNLAFENKEYEGLGVLITKIGEKENGADNRYWQYWVNHKKPEVGASAYNPKPGDFIEWKFIPFKGE